MVLKKIFDFYINSSIHVALAVVSLSLITMFHFEAEVNFLLLFFIFFGTVTGYNFVKYAGVAGLHHQSLARGLKNIQIFSFLCFAGLAVTAFMVNLEVLLWCVIFGTFTLLYALPVFSKRRNLRSISGIKIFIIALVWAGVTVILPVTDVKNGIFGDPFLEFLQRFLLVLVWILPFEIRDLKYDLEHLGTVPQRIGVTKTKMVGLVMLAMVILLEFFKSRISLTFLIAFVVMCVVTGFFLLGSKEKQNRYFTSFWIESIPILWLLVLVLLRRF